MNFVQNKKIGYLLAFFLGALGAHAFYYKRYIRGIVYASISLIISPLIPVMVLVGWVDMFFIKKWHRELNEEVEEIPKQNKNVTSLTQEADFSDNQGHKDQPKVRENIEKPKKSLFSFYSEEANILDRYSHLETPPHILQEVKKALREDVTTNRGVRFSIHTPGRNFIKDSNKYSNKGQNAAREIPFQAYYTSFSDLNDKQKKWYFYWRQEVLNNKYMDVDLSYIFLFVYELLNYSFNSKASFNVSVLTTLLNEYKGRHPKLEKYLNTWIADMLYELNEQELAKEWDSNVEHEPDLYQVIKKGIPLNKVSMNTWKAYYNNQRETAFFSENRNKIYKHYKKSVQLLKEYYESKGKDLSDIWFEVKEERNVRSLFRGAVVGRELEGVHEYHRVIRPTEDLAKNINTLIRVTENITRKLNGINRKIKVNEENLPEGFIEQLEDHFFSEVQSIKTEFSKDENTSNSKTQNRDDLPNERFKEVIASNNNPNETPGSRIPTSELGKESESPPITFDDEKINTAAEIFSDSDPTRYAQTEEDDAELPTPPLFEVVDEEVNEEKIDNFVSSLTSVEQSFLEKFSEHVITKEEAESFSAERKTMLGVLLSDINTKSNKYFGEPVLESIGSEIEFDEDYKTVLRKAKERKAHEN